MENKNLITITVRNTNPAPAADTTTTTTITATTFGFCLIGLYFGSCRSITKSTMSMYCRKNLVTIYLFICIYLITCMTIQQDTVYRS